MSQILQHYGNYIYILMTMTSNLLHGVMWVVRTWTIRKRFQRFRKTYCLPSSCFYSEPASCHLQVLPWT